MYSADTMMSEQNLANPVPQYQPLPGVYDELLDQRGMPREKYKFILNSYQEIGESELLQRRKELSRLLKENGVTYTSYAELSQRPEVYQLIEGVITHVNSLLPEALAIRRFINLPKEFDPDDGEVTRTRKLRRNVIDEHYAAVIAALYDGSASVAHRAKITYETGATGTLDRTLAVKTIGAR